MLKLKPWEFEALTRREFDAMLEGYDDALAMPAPGFAWLGSLILNMFATEFVHTPETLLGRKISR